MISRQSILRRRSNFHLTCTKRGLALPSFSGLGSRLLKSAERDPKTVGIRPGIKAPAPGDPPKRTSIFSKPAGSIPAVNKTVESKTGVNTQLPTGETVRPRFSMSAILQNKARMPVGDVRKPPSSTMNAARTASIPTPTAPLTRPGLSGAASIRDFARRNENQEKQRAADASLQPTLQVFGASDIFSKSELEDMADEHEHGQTYGTDGILSDAASIRNDVLGASGRDAVDDEDDGPKEELTAGEIRYWQYQVLH